MTKERWIIEATERIASNNRFIAEICDMVGSDFSRHRTDMERAKSENIFLKSGIKLMATYED